MAEVLTESEVAELRAAFNEPKDGAAWTEVWMPSAEYNAGQQVPRLCDSNEELRARLERVEGERTKLQAFKDWVHSYLDAHGVPHHPPGTHGAEGCRIGDRLDWLLVQRDRLESVASALKVLEGEFGSMGPAEVQEAITLLRATLGAAGERSEDG